METKITNTGEFGSLFNGHTPTFEVGIQLSASEEEIKELIGFGLWDRPLTVSVPGIGDVQLTNPYYERDTLTLCDLVNGSFGMVTSDALEALAAKKLVVSAINQNKALLPELRTLLN